MAIAVISQSTVTLTVNGTAYTAGSAVTSGKTVVLQADLSDMVNGEVVELDCYIKTAGTGGSAGLYFNQIFVDAQTGSPVYQSIPVAAPYSIEFKFVQVTGSGVVVPICLMTID